VVRETQLVFPIPSISDVMFGLAQREERMDRVAISLITKGLMSLIVLGVALKLTGSLVAASAALALLWLGLLVSIDLAICRQVYRETGEGSLVGTLRPTFVRSAMIGILVLGAPLGVARLLVSIQTSIPRYVLDHFSGERALGIFAALVYLIVIGNRFMLSLGQSVAPRLARHHVSGDGRAFRQLYFRMLAVAVVFGTVGIAAARIAGDRILGLLYGPDYAEYNQVFVWIMVAAAFHYLVIFMDYAMIATRWTRIQVPLMLGATLTLTLGPKRGNYASTGT